MTTATVPDVRRSLADPLRDAAVFVGRSTRHSVRSIDALVTSIVLPVAILLLFVYVFGGALSQSGDYVDYVVPGIILLCASMGASTTAIKVNDDMTNGVIDRFRSMPITGAAVLTGHVVASVARNLASTAVVLGVALLIGFRPEGDPLAWLAVAGVLALYMTAISWLSGRSRSPSCSCPTCPAPSCRPTRCRPRSGASPRTSPSRRSPRPCAA